MDWEKYPVQIGAGDSGTDGLDLLICLQAAVPGNASQYRRIADLIVDDAEQKQWARARFRYYRDSGIEPKTHKL